MGNADQIKIGVKGRAYVGPVGTTFPASPFVAWGTGWVDLGYMHPDGLEEALGEDRTEIPAWGEEAPVKTRVKSRDGSFKLTFLETNAELLQLYYAVLADDMTATAATSGNPGFISFGTGQASPGIERALGIDIIESDDIERIMIARVDVSDRGNRKRSADDASSFELTFKPLAAPNGGQAVQRFITNVTLPVEAP
ncbi:phage tail protein (plasmid) [Streptomyces sp. QHH-9511]|uniref:phage tail tube protein n=1 Tax=Streptomyces sp. QHH-9511 TaxID=2684468 RepID=UPI00131961CE|nr:phage tail protein [Streptomyces sp. QHH-9511]QGZ53368.1 phage tail protein [Streptomyces sp. QHH-9511]